MYVSLSITPAAIARGRSRTCSLRLAVVPIQSVSTGWRRSAIELLSQMPPGLQFRRRSYVDGLRRFPALLPEDCPLLGYPFIVA